MTRAELEKARRARRVLLAADEALLQGSASWIKDESEREKFIAQWRAARELNAPPPLPDVADEDLEVSQAAEDACPETAEEWVEFCRRKD